MDDTTVLSDKLDKLQQEVDALKSRRLSQLDIIPGTIKVRHLGEDVIPPTMPLFNNVKYVRISDGGIPSGNYDIYTCPQGRKCLITFFRSYNPTGGSISLYSQLKIGGNYVRLTATTALSSTSFSTAVRQIVLRGGESLTINSTAAGLNVFGSGMEVSSDSPLYCARLLESLNSGYNLIYQVPPGKMAWILNDIGHLFWYSALWYINTSGGSRTVGFYVVPAGQSPSQNHRFQPESAVANNASGTSFPENLGALNAGDSVYINTSGTGVQPTWINYVELPVV